MYVKSQLSSRLLYILSLGCCFDLRLEVRDREEEAELWCAPFCDFEVSGGKREEEADSRRARFCGLSFVEGGREAEADSSRAPFCDFSLTGRDREGVVELW